MRSFASYSNLVEIGRGGMARVYRANTPTGHLVALKILSLHLANDKSALLRFKQESNLGLDHPNIVRVIESGVDKDRGEPYIVMDYVPSESLEQRISRVKRIGTAEIVRVITDVGKALDYAHERGIIHRDVKPGNILLRANSDQALLTDFGIAKTPFATAYTATIARVGSVLYMSPEQAAGAPTLTRASDIYSLAVTVYYALSGKHPFESTDPIVVARQHIDLQPVHVCDMNPSIPRSVGDVVMQALNKQPHLRPPSAGRFARLLAEAAQAKQGTDPMKRTTATFRMPPNNGAGASSAPPLGATTPTSASRTVPSSSASPSSTLSNATAPRAELPRTKPAYNAPLPADSLPTQNIAARNGSPLDPFAPPKPPLNWRGIATWSLVGAAVVVLALLAFDGVIETTPTGGTPTPPMPTIAAVTNVVGSRTEPTAATVPVVIQPTGAAAPTNTGLPNNAATAIIYVTASAPTLPLPPTTPPRMTAVPPPPVTRAPTLPPQPTATQSGVFVPTVISLPSDTPAPLPPSSTPTTPPDTPVPSDTPQPPPTTPPTATEPPTVAPLPSDTPAPTETIETPPTPNTAVLDTPSPTLESAPTESPTASP